MCVAPGGFTRGGFATTATWCHAEARRLAEARKTAAATATACTERAEDCRGTEDGDGQSITPFRWSFLGVWRRDPCPTPPFSMPFVVLCELCASLCSLCQLLQSYLQFSAPPRASAPPRDTSLRLRTLTCESRRRRGMQPLQSAAFSPARSHAQYGEKLTHDTLRVSNGTLLRPLFRDARFRCRFIAECASPMTCTHDYVSSSLG